MENLSGWEIDIHRYGDIFIMWEIIYPHRRGGFFYGGDTLADPPVLRAVGLDATIPRHVGIPCKLS